MSLFALCVLCSDGTLNPHGVRFGSAEIYNISECITFSSVWFACDQMWLVCDQNVICMWSKCDSHVICMWSKCDLHVIKMWWYCVSRLVLVLLALAEQMEEIADSLCVGQQYQGDERVVLFLKMAAGYRYCRRITWPHVVVMWPWYSLPPVSFSNELVKKVKSEIRSQLSARHVPSIVLETKDIPVSVFYVACHRLPYSLTADFSLSFSSSLSLSFLFLSLSLSFSSSLPPSLPLSPSPSLPLFPLSLSPLLPLLLPVHYQFEESWGSSEEDHFRRRHPTAWSTG